MSTINNTDSRASGQGSREGLECAFDYPSALDIALVVVDDDRLPGGQGSLALVEAHAAGSIRARFEGTGHGSVVLSYLGEAPKGKGPIPRSVEPEVRGK